MITWPAASNCGRSRVGAGLHPRRGPSAYESLFADLCLSAADNFRRRDTMHQGSVNFQYDDVSSALPFRRRLSASAEIKAFGIAE